jgi:putative exporter of polyketide antibiotics
MVNKNIYTFKTNSKIIRTFLVIFYIMDMTREEKLNKLESLRSKAVSLKKEVDYYNALQTALKLILNGSYV